MRDGGQGIVPNADVVAGDVMILEAGAVVPADLRLIEVAGLRVDESALTGEFVPVEKQTNAVQDKAGRR